MNHFDAFQADAMAQFQRRPNVHATDVAARQQGAVQTVFTPRQLKERAAQRRYQAQHEAEQAERAAKGLAHD